MKRWQHVGMNHAGGCRMKLLALLRTVSRIRLTQHHLLLRRQYSVLRRQEVFNGFDYVATTTLQE